VCLYIHIYAYVYSNTQKPFFISISCSDCRVCVCNYCSCMLISCELSSLVLLLYIYMRLTTGWTVRDRIPVGTRFPAFPNRPWGPPNLLYNGNRVFPGGKVWPGRAADHSPPSSAAIMEEQSYTSTHPLGHTGPVTRYFYHIYIYIYTDTDRQTHTHTHTHTHTRTQTKKPFAPCFLLLANRDHQEALNAVTPCSDQSAGCHKGDVQFVTHIS
jgi:hypothetical protein